VNARSPLPIFGLRNNTFDMLTYIRYQRPSDLPYFWISTLPSREKPTTSAANSGIAIGRPDVGFVGGTNNPIARGLPQFEATGYIILGPAYDYPKVWSSITINKPAASPGFTAAQHQTGGDFLAYAVLLPASMATCAAVSRLTRASPANRWRFPVGWPSSSRRQLDAAGPYHLISNYSTYIQAIGGGAHRSR